MRNPLAPEAALGFVTLLVCVPIAGVWLYMGRDVPQQFAGFVAHPLRYPNALIALTVTLTLSLLEWIVKGVWRRIRSRRAH